MSLDQLQFGRVSGDAVIAPSRLPFAPRPVPADVGFFDALGAAYRMDTIIGDIAKGSVAVPEQPGDNERADVWGMIGGTPYEEHFESFAGLETAFQVRQMMEKLDRENDDRMLLEEAGAYGLMAELVAGIFDLPSLVPGGVALKGIRGGAQAARVGAKTGAAAGMEAAAVEAYLQQRQETRTAGESAAVIGGSVVLGGLLGTGVAALVARSPGGTEAFQSAARAIDEGNGDRFSGDLSAAARIRPEITDFDLPTSAAQALKDTTPSGLSYTTRFANSRSPVLRGIGNDLLQNSYAYAGTERLQMQPAVDTFAAIAEDKARISIARVFKDDFAAYKKAPGDKPILSHWDWSQRVAAAMRRGDADLDYPSVTAAAQKLRREVVEPMKERAIEMGLLPKDVTPETAVSYFTRMWDANQIQARSNEFLPRMRQHFETGIRSGAFAETDLARQRVAGLENELRNLSDEALDTRPDVTQFLNEESAIASRAAELRREAAKIGKRPLGRRIVEMGGIDPKGAAAAELRSLGVTPQNSPGLFRQGGLRDVDNLVAQEFDDMADAIGVDRSFLNRQGVLDALSEEAAGSPRFGARDRAVIDELADLDEMLALGRNKVGPEDRAARQQIKKLRDRIRAAEEASRAAAVRADYTEDEIRAFAEEAANDVFRTLTRVDVSPSELLNITVGVERGPLAQRTLNVKDVDWEDFLNNDAEFVLGRYARVMSAETELTRRFGRADMKDQIDEVNADYDSIRDNAKSDKERKEIEAERARAIKSLKAARDQVRGTYLAAERASGTYRTVQGAQTFNYVRALGDVLRSSIPDVIKPSMVHGMRSMFGDGLVPLIRNAGRARAAMREISDAAGISEVLLNNRMMRIADITDPYATRTPIENTLNWMGNKASLFSGILHWNQFLKEIDGYLLTQRMRRLNLSSPSKRDARMMQRLKLTKANMERIKAQMDAHGSEVDGVFTPNIEDWDSDVARLYAAAVRADTETVIVTPGIGEKVPLAEEKWFLKPALQFKQFALSSHQKTLGVGLQEDPARFLSNAALMTSMGMFVYWLKAQSLAKDRLSDNPGVWLAEGIDRAGLVPVYMEVNNMFERIGGPGVYYGLGSALGDSPERATRYQVRSFAGSLFGPTFGLLNDTAAVVGAGLKGDFTPGDVSSMRRLVPFGNIPGIKEYLNLWAVPALKDAVE